MRIAVNRREGLQTGQQYDGVERIVGPRNPWPDSVALREAVQNPAANIGDSELRQAQISINRQGLPVAYTGRFAAVFRLVTNEGEAWAYRCFTHPPEEGQSINGERGARYQLIAHHLSKFDDLFVPYRYIERGVKVGQSWYPAVAMQWASGETLGKFVERNLRRPDALRRVAGALSDALLRLEAAGLAHGDWQHDNLLVTRDGRAVTLVDYDGMFVPELEGFPAPEYGHANYQHPARTPDHYAVGLDRFACLVIQTALLALAHDPSLWNKHSDGDSLLFRQSDLRDPNRSPLFQTLRTLVAQTQDDLLADTLARLEDACNADPLATLPPAVPAVAPPPVDNSEAGKKAQQIVWQESLRAAEEANEQAQTMRSTETRREETQPTTPRGKWWLAGAANAVENNEAVTSTSNSSTEVSMSPVGLQLGNRVSTRPSWLYSQQQQQTQTSSAATTPRQRTTSQTTLSRTNYPDAFRFLEKLAASEANGEETRHLWQARTLALVFLVSAMVAMPFLLQTSGLWFLFWFAGLQMFNGASALFRKWPRKLIGEELDAEIAKMDHAIRERQARLMAPANALRQSPEEFITQHLEKTPIYRVLTVPGIDVAVLNRLHHEGIETALNLRDRQGIYGVTQHEMAALQLWCRNVEMEAAALYRTRHPSSTAQGISPNDVSRIEQEVAEFERERDKLLREKEQFPDASPGAYVARLMGRS